jgi:O-antigen/teichoic acid export membrane protein
VQLIREGVSYLPSTTFFVIADYVSRAILAQSAGLSDVGYVGVAFRIASVMTLATAAFSLAWGPLGMAQTSDASTGKLFGRVLIGSSIVAFGVALIVAAAGPELVRMIAGETYSGASVALPGIIVGAAISACFFILTVAAGVSGRAQAVAWSATAGAILQILLAAVLVPAIGLAGVGVAVLGGRAGAVLMIIPVARAAVRTRWTAFVLALIAVVAAALALQVINAFSSHLLVVRVGAVVVVSLASGVLLRMTWRDLSSSFWVSRHEEVVH